VYYKKIETDRCIIVYEVNWLGMETISIEGQIVSKKFSLRGTSHNFFRHENNIKIAYTLTTKESSKEKNQISISIIRNNKLIVDNILVNYETKTKETNKSKIIGTKYLDEYEIDLAIEEFSKALIVNREDPEIYFFLACCYSIQEKSERGFECIIAALEYKFDNIGLLLNHEMLAFLRVQEEFKDIIKSKLTKFDDE